MKNKIYEEYHICESRINRRKKSIRPMLRAKNEAYKKLDEMVASGVKIKGESASRMTNALQNEAEVRAWIIYNLQDEQNYQNSLDLLLDPNIETDVAKFLII